MYPNNRSLVYVFFTSFITLVVSIISGNQGVDAFYASLFATGIILLFGMFSLLKFIFQGSLHIIFKTLLAPILVIVPVFIFLIIGGITFERDINPYIPPPTVSWLIVGLSSLAFVFQIFLAERANPSNLRTISVKIVSSIWSCLIMFFGFISYMSSASDFRVFSMLLASQLAFLANYIYSETKYIDNVMTFFKSKYGHTSDDHFNIMIVVLIIPYMIPIILFLLLYKR